MRSWSRFGEGGGSADWTGGACLPAAGPMQLAMDAMKPTSSCRIAKSDSAPHPPPNQTPLSTVTFSFFRMIRSTDIALSRCPMRRTDPPLVHSPKT